jgi:hypothetical protein
LPRCFLPRSSEVDSRTKKTEKILFVTDDETVIVNALKEHFPNVDAYRCWNHIIVDYPSNTLYRADVGPIDFLVGNIAQLSRLSSDSQSTIQILPSFFVGV